MYFSPFNLTFSLIVESGSLMKRCKTDDDCGGSECTKDGTCASVSIDCCWMPPIYCCGPGSASE